MFRAVKHGNVHESKYELGILGSALLPSKILFIKRNILLELITSLDWGHRRLLDIFYKGWTISYPNGFKEDWNRKVNFLKMQTSNDWHPSSCFNHPWLNKLSPFYISVIHQFWILISISNPTVWGAAVPPLIGDMWVSWRVNIKPFFHNNHCYMLSFISTQKFTYKGQLLSDFPYKK